LNGGLATCPLKPIAESRLLEIFPIIDDLWLSVVDRCLLPSLIDHFKDVVIALVNGEWAR
jgi:hypothetical protein